MKMNEYIIGGILTSGVTVWIGKLTGGGMFVAVGILVDSTKYKKACAAAPGIERPKLSVLVVYTSRA